MMGNFRPGFTIWRKDLTGNGQGQFTETYADTGQTVNGRLSPLSPQSAGDLIIGGQVIGRVTHMFSCPASVDVGVGDEVRGGAETVTVEAVRTTSNQRRKECLCTSDQRAA